MNTPICVAVSFCFLSGPAVSTNLLLPVCDCTTTSSQLASNETKQVEKQIGEQLESLLKVRSDYDWRIFSSSFMPLEFHRKNASMPRQDWNPPEEAMCNIVALGLKAIPSLLKGLDDPRDSCFQIKAHTLYHARKVKVEALDSSLRSLCNLAYSRQEDGNQYRARIGDLCMFMLGQIVNRDYTFVCYQPTNILTVMSPLDEPKLTTQIKNIWTGLSEERHIEDLCKETTGTYYRFSSMERLVYYYPKFGETLAIKLLRRPTYDAQCVRSYVTDVLLKLEDENEISTSLSNFKRTKGQVNLCGVFRSLHSGNYLFPQETLVSSVVYAKRVERLLTFFAREANVDPVFDSANIIEHTGIVRCLSNVRSAQIDDAVAAAFERIDKGAYKNRFEKIYLDDLVLVICQRWGDRFPGEAFLEYCNDREQELNKRELEPAERERLGEITEMIPKLKKKKARSEN